MPRARQHLVCVSDTPFYHVYSRCVRRAFLCGIDRHTGRSYEHRRAWIEDRVRVLASLFSIDLCAYAVMSNHYHLVVKLNPTEPDAWSDDEVLQRWTSLFRGPLLVTFHGYDVHIIPQRMGIGYYDRLFTRAARITVGTDFMRERLLTLVHELYHISPRCDGDLRRFKGRNHAHGHSRKAYDAMLAPVCAAAEEPASPRATSGVSCPRARTPGIPSTW